MFYQAAFNTSQASATSSAAAHQAMQKGLVTAMIGQVLGVAIWHHLVELLTNNDTNLLSFSVILMAMAWAFEYPHNFFANKNPKLVWIHWVGHCASILIYNLVHHFTGGTDLTKGTMYSTLETIKTHDWVHTVLMFVGISFTGAMWYGPLFGKFWASLEFPKQKWEDLVNNKSKELEKAGEKGMQAALISSAILALTFDHLLHSTNPEGFFATLEVLWSVVWLTAVLDASHVFFEQRSPWITVLKVGYHLTYAAIAAAVATYVPAFLLFGQ